MKAKTNEEKRIVKLNEKLKKPNKKILDWAFKSCFKRLGILYKSGQVNCLECGYTWKNTLQDLQEKVISYQCPNCNAKLNVKNNKYNKVNDRTSTQFSSFGIIEIVEDCQVVRCFKITAKYKVKTLPNVKYYEIGRMFINSIGKSFYIGRYKTSYFYETYSNSFEFRKKSSLFLPYYFYPVFDLTPALTMRGLKIQEHKDLIFNNAHFLFSDLINYSFIETLLKANYLSLVNYSVGNTQRINQIKKYWPSIKLMIKNNQFIGSKNWIINWYDYLGLLKFFNKDLLNLKYISPNDLDKAHQKYLEKHRIFQHKKKVQELKAQLKKDDKIYQQRFAKFFSLNLVRDDISVKVISSAEQVMYYGNVLKHCIFSKEYHLKKDSLLLIAFYKNKPIETIEFDLCDWKISQSRGWQNKESEYHYDIVNLVNDNINVIKKLSIVKKKRKILKIA